MLKFSLAYDNVSADTVTFDSHRLYFVPRVEIRNYNVEIDGINFYD